MSLQPSSQLVHFLQNFLCTTERRSSCGSLHLLPLGPHVKVRVQTPPEHDSVSVFSFRLQTLILHLHLGIVLQRLKNVNFQLLSRCDKTLVDYCSQEINQMKS